jgi:hypothetical protein
MSALHLIDTAARVIDLTARAKKPAADLNIDGVEVLGWPLTGVAVTLNNEYVGTLHVRMRAFYQFRALCRNRGDIANDEKRGNVIRDLIAAFSYAMRIRWDGACRRDKLGNLILIDRDEKIMFIVDDDRNLLLAVFDKNESANANNL